MMGTVVTWLIVFTCGFIAGHNWRWKSAATSEQFVAIIMRGIRQMRDNNRYIGDGEIWCEYRSEIAFEGEDYALRIRRKRDAEKFGLRA